MKQVTIAIVSYNSGAHVLNCLNSVYAQTDPAFFDLIVVDNGSTDGSVEKIRAAFPQIDLRSQDSNLGFAAAVNLAFDGVCTPYLFCLNPDAELKDRALQHLLEIAAREPDAKIWGGRTVFEDGALNPTNCQRAISVWGVFCEALGLSGAFARSPWLNAGDYGGWLRDDTRPVDVVTGGAMLIKRDLWEHLGGFDTRFFMYGEDHDFCLRAKTVGARPMISHEAEILHHQGQSYARRADMWVHLLRAKITLARLHLGPVRGALARLCLRLYPLPRCLVFGFANHARRAVWSEVWTRREKWRDGY